MSQLLWGSRNPQVPILEAWVKPKSRRREVTLGSDTGPRQEQACTWLLPYHDAHCQWWSWEARALGLNWVPPGLWAEGVVDMGFVICRCFSDKIAWKGPSQALESFAFIAVAATGGGASGPVAGDCLISIRALESSLQHPEPYLDSSRTSLLHLDFSSLQWRPRWTFSRLWWTLEMWKFLRWTLSPIPVTVQEVLSVPVSANCDHSAQCCAVYCTHVLGGLRWGWVSLATFSVFTTLCRSLGLPKWH